MYFGDGARFLNTLFIFLCTYSNEYRHKYLNFIEMDVSKQTLITLPWVNQLQ